MNKPIMDWNNKVAAIAILLGKDKEKNRVPNEEFIVNAMDPVDYGKSGDEKEQIFIRNKNFASIISNWAHVAPTESNHEFIRRLLDKCEIVGLTTQSFIEKDFNVFFSYCPPEKKVHLSHLCVGTRKRVGNNNFNFIRFSTNISASQMSEDLRGSRTIDHKYCYLSIHAVAHWYEFINEEEYPLFHTCLSRIKRFLMTEIWCKFVSSHRFGGVVVLGGGAPSKDKRILDSVLSIKDDNNFDQFIYTIVDYSPFMLQETIRELRRLARKSEDSVFVSGLVIDFADLSRKEIYYLPQKEVSNNLSDKNISWFVLGNTLGNLDEEKFFQSLRDSSLPGDLLIIGNDMVPTDGINEYMDKIKKEYETPSVERFFRAPFNYWWESQPRDQNRKNESDNILQRKESYVIDNGDLTISKIPGNMTAIVEINYEDIKVRLLKSSRYRYKKLCEFAGHYKFKPYEDNLSSEGYNVMVFQRCHDN